MTAQIELRIDGQAKGKGRPRFNPRTGHVRTPNATRLFEANIVSAWTAAGSPRLPEGPVQLTVMVVCERPRDHYRAGGELGAKGVRSQWPVRTPDLDNVAKACADALNRRAYRDDAQIVVLSILRRWADPGETEHITIDARSLAPVADGALA